MPLCTVSLLPVARCQSSGPLGEHLEHLEPGCASSPALDVRLMTALQVLPVRGFSTGLSHTPHTNPARVSTGYNRYRRHRSKERERQRAQCIARYAKRLEAKPSLARARRSKLWLPFAGVRTAPIP